jgi:hypothetical protein
MRRFPNVVPVLSLALAAGALTLAACSDTTTSPTRGISPSAASLSVTPGTNSLTIVSDGSTQYCSSAQLNGGNTAVGDWSIPGTFAPIASGCGTALDLTSAINVYNPGWSMPFTGSSWIGITTKGGPSSDYRPNPGRYVFQETFSVPANVTNAVLDLHVKGDNVAAVYLNGTLLGAQPNTDCNSGTCNWNSDLHLTANLTAGTNYTLTFVVSDLPTGFPITTGPTGGPAPQYACPTRPFQTNGTAGYTATLVPTSPNHVVAGGGAGTPMTNIGLANQAGCENPMGLDFAGTVTWTPPVVTTWCSPGFWKNHEELWTGLLTVKYSTLSGAAPLSNKAPAGDPTIQQVIENPQIYGGPATNSVADYLSHIFFGTPIGQGVESCPDPSSIHLPS